MPFKANRVPGLNPFTIEPIYLLKSAQQNRSLLICNLRINIPATESASNKNKEASPAMPSVRYTRIEITPDAYRSLEAEAILQGKTLKKLASELILNGVSKKALDFVQESARPSTLSTPDMEFDEDTAKAMKKIGATGIHISDLTLQAVKKVILADGYQDAMLHVAQHTASMERDELHRVLAICRRYKLTLTVAAYLIENLNEIESGNWK